MGYESKIYITNVRRHKQEDGKVWTYAEIIAEFELRKMGHSVANSIDFCELFTNPIDYMIYVPGVNENNNECMVAKDTDGYGEHIKSGDINRIITWLEREAEQDNYRRLKPLIGMLKGFNADEWDDLQVIHYGH